MNRTLLLSLFLAVGCGDKDGLTGSDEPCDDGTPSCVEDVEDGGTYDATCVDGAWVFDENSDGERSRCFFH